MDQKRYSSVKNFPALYPHADFTENTIRRLISNRKENGFGRCLRRVGKKVLIDVKAFEDWLEGS
jgi:hypothetical protein